MASTSQQELPVFVFPSSFVFSPSSHKHMLTIYNPYDFETQYKVLCTSSSTYSVIEPQGTLRAKSCVDVIIRLLHKNASNANNAQHTFRITMSNSKRGSVAGTKDIISRVFATQHDAERYEITTAPMNRSSDFNVATRNVAGSNPHGRRSEGDQNSGRHMVQGERIIEGMAVNRNTQAQFVTLVAVALACGLVLILPSADEPTDKPSIFAFWPAQALPSMAQRLAAAYALGIVTILLITR